MKKAKKTAVVETSEEITRAANKTLAHDTERVIADVFPPEPTAPGVTHDEALAVKGNTYPVRVRMRALGGEWDKPEQTWRFPCIEAASAARSIVAAVGPKVTAKTQDESALVTV